MRRRVWVFVIGVLWLPLCDLSVEAATTSAKQAKEGHEKPAEAGTTSGASSAKAGATQKSDQQSVQPRGIFEKKKKKQLGRSTGPSQSTEGTDSRIEEKKGSATDSLTSGVKPIDPPR